MRCCLPGLEQLRVGHVTLECMRTEGTCDAQLGTLVRTVRKGRRRSELQGISQRAMRYSPSNTALAPLTAPSLNQNEAGLTNTILHEPAHAETTIAQLVWRHFDVAHASLALATFATSRSDTKLRN